MKNLIFLFVLIFGSNIAISQNVQEDKTLSPYFSISSSENKVEDFPLKKTDVNVNISGPIASVKIEQHYENNGPTVIHADYVFPMSTKAAVYGMTVFYGEKKLKAKIEEKNKARQIFQQAKEAGKRTSLLEQERPNVFRMNVANILPGEKVKVVLEYTEFINPTDKNYEFVFPAVVGPRFIDPSKKEEPGVFDSKYNTGKAVDYPCEFMMYVNVISAVPLQKIVSKSHKITVTKNTENFATVRFTNPITTFEGNRDFILSYSLRGEKVEAGTITFEGEDENFFLSVIEPPARLDREDIPPREYIFIVDVSGSMRGFPMDVSKTLLKNLIGNLRPTDMFNVMLFASSSMVLSEESLEANMSNLNKAINLLDNQQGGGGTMLLPALERAIGLPSCGRDISRSVVIVTDGYVHVEEEAFNLIGNNLNDANVFSFGIGKSINRHLIEGLAKVGRGESFVITEKKFAKKTAENFRKYIEYPIMTGIDIQFKNMDAYDITPKSIPDLFADRPLYVFGKYKGKTKGQLVVSGFTGKSVYNNRTAIQQKSNRHKEGLKYLWAREKIAELNMLNYVNKSQDRIKEITQLGLDYNLMTEYTSFVAVDDEVMTQEEAETVKQPRPLPAHVPTTAIGFEMDLGEEVVRSGSVANVHTKFSECSVSLTKTERESITNTIKEILKENGILSLLQENIILRVEFSKGGGIVKVQCADSELDEAFNRMLKGLLVNIQKEEGYHLCITI